MPQKGTKRKDEIELDPKGWERFEAAVNAAVRAGPQHRQAIPKAKPERSAARKPERRRKG
jgi:hypothetical protein